MFETDRMISAIGKGVQLTRPSIERRKQIRDKGPKW